MPNFKSVIYAFYLPFILVMVAVSPVQAETKSIATTTILTDDSEYSQFVAEHGAAIDAEIYSDFQIPALNVEKKQLAESLFERTYNLYSSEFYDYIFDRNRAKILQPYDTYSQALSSGRLNKEKKTLAQCLTYTNQPLRYQKFAKYFVYDYVDHNSIEEVQDGLKMLEHFFIDDLALALQKSGGRNADELNADFYSKLKQQDLEDTYDELLNSPKYDDFQKSSKYDMTRSLAHMEIEGSQSYSPLLMFYIFASSAYCLEKYDSDAP